MVDRLQNYISFSGGLIKASIALVNMIFFSNLTEYCDMQKVFLKVFHTFCVKWGVSAKGKIDVKLLSKK